MGRGKGGGCDYETCWAASDVCCCVTQPIGVMKMLDQGEQDDKIIAVHHDDPEFTGYRDISELPAHRMAEIRRCVSI